MFTRPTPRPVSFADPSACNSRGTGVPSIIALAIMLAGLAWLSACGDDNASQQRLTGPTKMTPTGYTRVPGTRVSLKTPAGFELDPSLPGFTSRDRDASIMIVETEAGLLAASKRFDDASLKERGITLLGTESATIDEWPAILHHTAQVENDRVVERWIAAAGDGELAALIYVAFPRDRTDEYADLLKRTMLEASWDRFGPINAYEGLRFTLGGITTLQEPKRLGSIVAVRPDPMPKNPVAGGPVFTATCAQSREARYDARAFAAAQIFELGSLSQVTTRGGTGAEGEVILNPITLDGLDGYEGTFDAKDRTGRDDMVLYQVVVFDGPTYYLMQAVTNANRESKDLPAFKALARTFTRK